MAKKKLKGGSTLEDRIAPGIIGGDLAEGMAETVDAPPAEDTGGSFDTPQTEEAPAADWNFDGPPEGEDGEGSAGEGEGAP